jgi:RecA-family ATPase
MTDRSAAFFAAVRTAVEDGMTAPDFEVLAREFPNGCSAKYLRPRDRLQQEIARVWEPHAAQMAKLDASGANNTTELLRSQSKKPILPILRASNLHGQLIPAREWHVVDVIPGRNVTLLQGDGATGKSILALMLAVSTALGTSWIGLEAVKRGPAVYLSAEDELPELHRRLDNIAQHQGVSLQAFSDLHLIPLAGEDAVLAAPVGRSNIIEATQLWAALRKCVSELKPRLVVLDTLADLFAGEENQRTQARQFISMLRRLALDNDLCVLLLGHPSLEGLRSGSGTSGSTGWNNSVRSRLYFERVFITEGNKVIEQDEDVRELTVKKANYGRKAEPIRLKWVDGIFERQSGGAFSLDGAQRNAAADKAFVALLQLHERLGMPVSPNASSIYAPTVFATHSQANGITKRAFKGAMERLLETGKIRVIQEGPPSKRRVRLTSYAEENT